jgi:hypothetical protein
MRRATSALLLAVVGVAIIAWPIVVNADHYTDIHWRVLERPLSLTVVARVGGQWDEIVDQKVNQWDNLVAPGLFDFTVDHRAAQIGCEFENPDTVVVCENNSQDYYGVTVLVWEYNENDTRHIRKAKILLSNTLHDGEPEAERRITVCHEFGHAMGLWGHSHHLNASCVTNNGDLQAPGEHDKGGLESNALYGHTH